MKFVDKLKKFCFVDDSRDVFLNATKFACYLKQNQIKSVEIYLSNSCDFCIAFFGSLMAKVHTINLAKRVFSGEHTIVSDENFAMFLDSSNEFDGSFDENAKFYLQTSGSSGNSKLIEKSLKSMILEASYLSKTLGFNSQNTIFASVSHQHMFGLTYKIFFAIMLEAKCVCAELNYPEVIFELDLKGHIFITSPVLLKTIIQSPRANELSGVCGIISAGSELKNELRVELEKICNARIIDIYGSTETGTIAKNLGQGLCLLDAVKAGLDERETLNVSSAWCDFFQSNDLAVINGDKLGLLGRFDRVVKLNDKRVSLESVEKKLLESGILSDCYCAMHPKFKRLAALLELNEAGIDKFRKTGKQGVVAILNKILNPEYKNSIRHFKIVENLPRNQQGKFAKESFEEVLFRQISPIWQRVDESVDGFKFRSLMSVELEIFTHHFYSLPLIPGFFQLDFVMTLAKSVGVKFGKKISVENLKFTKFVRPNDTLEIAFKPLEDRLNFEIFCNGNKCSVGRIKFEL